MATLLRPLGLGAALLVGLGLPAVTASAHAASPMATGRSGPTAPASGPDYAPILPALRRTRVPLCLLSDVGVMSPGLHIYATILSGPGINAVTPTSYEIELGYTPNCNSATACRLGTLQGTLVALGAPRPTGRALRLAEGLTGYYTPFACGASCGDATITWDQGDARYTVGLKAGQEPVVARMADSAIVAAPPSLAVAGCRTAQLTVAPEDGDAGASNRAVRYRIHNRSAHSCTLYGYPGIQLLDANRRPLPTHLTWSTIAYLFTGPPARLVRLTSGGDAFFALGWSHAPPAPGACPPAPYMLVTPPNERTSLLLRDGPDSCGGRLTASPVQAARFHI